MPKNPAAMIVKWIACNVSRSCATGLTVALMLGSAPARSADAFDAVTKQEISGSQIGWFVNRTFDAFVKATEEAKPLIIVFGDETSPYTQAFAKYVTPCPQLNQLAGIAIFAYGAPKVDEFAKRAAVHLKLSIYPTVSIIAPRTDRLTEESRLEGFASAQGLSDYLQRALQSSKRWPSGFSVRKLPSHYLAYPGKACTLEGAKRLGILSQGATEP